jgi:hypothetical protein
MRDELLPSANAMRRWFSEDEIRIEASPTEIIFQDGDRQIALPTTVWVNTQGRIQMLGPSLPGAPALTRVDLFRPAPTDPPVSRLTMLESLLRYGLGLLVTEHIFKVSPHIRFGSLRSFDPLLSGFQRELFENAARAAGARVVAFEDTAA